MCQGLGRPSAFLSRAILRIVGHVRVKETVVRTRGRSKQSIQSRVNKIQMGASFVRLAARGVLKRFGAGYMVIRGGRAETTREYRPGRSRTSVGK